MSSPNHLRSSLKTSKRAKSLPKNSNFLMENDNEKIPLEKSLKYQNSMKYLKKSTLYSLSGILHRWCKKELVLNLFNNTLLIRKKGKENLLYLSRCSIKNIGKFKKKWCFSLLTSSSGEEKAKSSKKLKKYIIGCDEKTALEEWLALLTEELHVKIKAFFIVFSLFFHCFFIFFFIVFSLFFRKA